jgi:hypothetical protein
MVATMRGVRRPLRLHVAERTALLGQPELVRRASDVWWLLDLWATFVVEAEGEHVGWEEVAKAVTDAGMSRRTAYRYRDLARRVFPDMELEAVVSATAQARREAGWGGVPPNAPDRPLLELSDGERNELIAAYPEEWGRALRLATGYGGLDVDLPELARPTGAAPPARAPARRGRRPRAEA